MTVSSFNPQLSSSGSFTSQINPTHEEINRQLTQAVMAPQAGALPSVDLLKYAAGLFNLYCQPNLPFQPSIAVRVKLLELAGATRENSARMLNFTQLSPQDLAAIFRIINAYSRNYEVPNRPHDPVFPTIIRNLTQYMIFLCNDDRGVLVLQTLTSYQDPSLAEVTAHMSKALGARAVRQEEPPRSLPAGSSSPQNIDLRPSSVPPTTQRTPDVIPEIPLAFQVHAPQDDLVGQLLEANDRLSSENQALLRQVTQLQQETGALTQQLILAHTHHALGDEGAGASVGISQDRILRANQDREYTEALLADQGNEIQRLQVALAKQEQELQQKDQRIENLIQVITLTERDNGILKENQSESSRRLQAQQQRIDQYEKQIATLQGAPATAQPAKAASVATKADSATIKDLRERNDQLVIQNGNLDRQVKDLSAQLRAQKTASQTTVQEARRAKEEILALKEEVARLKAQLQESK